jgi:hypothetical protein
MGDRRSAYGVLVGSLDGKTLLGVDGWVVSKWLFKKWDG